MMAMPPGGICLLNSPQLIELHGTRGGSGAALSQEAGAGAMGHVAAPELSCARRRELAPQDTWQHPSCPKPELGSWGHGTRGGTRAARARRPELVPQEVW
jgi:hypothetical protein